MSDELLNLLGEDEMFLLDDAEMSSQISDAELSSVQALGDRFLKLDRLETKVKEILEKISEARKDITDNRIPKKLMEIGLSSFTLATGETIQVKHIVAANMPNVEKDPEGFAKARDWLDEQDLGDLLKKEVIAKFGKGEGEKAQRVFDEIMRITNGDTPLSMKEGVNYQTLNAVFRQRMKEGRPLPTIDNGFTIYMGPRAEIVRKKSK